ncbi:MAG: (2Fe-2S)-binding protein [Candidatus Izemoplasmatales bacterium]|nr:(2Fe-2S)-binding protein [Candidatus Izemoplasmatales bacterium]
MNKEPNIICRCEDVTVEQVRELLQKGYTHFEDLKRQLRVGMGPCQGQNCQEMIRREIATFLGVSIEDVPTHTVRPLIIGVPLEAIKAAKKR